MNTDTDAELAPGPATAYDLDANDESQTVLARLFAEFGDFCRVPGAQRDADSFVIHAPEDIRRVMVVRRQNFRKGVGLDRVRVLLGNGIMVSEGDFWTRQRRMIQPAFHSRVLHRFSTLMRDHNLVLLRRWARHAETGEPVNLTEEMSRLTLDIVLHALFSDDLDALTAADGTHPFLVVTEESARDLAFAARFRALTRHVRQMMAARREEQRYPFDFLSMLMQATDKHSGAPMADKALVDEIMTLIVAGHETTASALNWTWYLLSQQPRYFAELRDEATALDPGTLDVERAMQQSAARRTMYEGLRLYPPGWLLGRVAVDEDVLSGHRIPAGSNVMICPYLLHRHPAHWAEPDAFRPDLHFADGAVAERHRFAYIPFAAGPRHCVGENFAIAEMLMHLALVARHFSMEYLGDAPPAPEFQINLRTRTPVMMRLAQHAPLPD